MPAVKKHQLPGCVTPFVDDVPCKMLTHAHWSFYADEVSGYLYPDER